MKGQHEPPTPYPHACSPARALKGNNKAIPNRETPRDAFATNLPSFGTLRPGSPQRGSSRMLGLDLVLRRGRRPGRIRTKRLKGPPLNPPPTPHRHACAPPRALTGKIKAKPSEGPSARRLRIRHNRSPESSASRLCTRPRQTPPPISCQTTGTAETTSSSPGKRALPQEAPLPKLPARNEKLRAPRSRPRKKFLPPILPPFPFVPPQAGCTAAPTPPHSTATMKRPDGAAPKEKPPNPTVRRPTVAADERRLISVPDPQRPALTEAGLTPDGRNARSGRQPQR